MIRNDLERIESALDRAADVLAEFTSGDIEMTRKQGGSPLTEADLAVDEALRTSLPLPGEGWLSEETADDRGRLACARTWIVDPIDGTREFVDGIPEWCVSIGLSIDGAAVAGGVLNPATGERIVGAVGLGVSYDGHRPPVSADSLARASVAASRSEIRRGEWSQFGSGPFELVPMGSVAYKNALVAAGRIDATWTLSPKNEWDLAGPAALLNAVDALAVLPDGSQRRWNLEHTRMPGFVAAQPGVADEVAVLVIS